MSCIENLFKEHYTRMIRKVSETSLEILLKVFSLYFDYSLYPENEVYC